MRDVTDLLTEAAPRPTTDVDPDEIWIGARRRRRRRHVLAAVTGFVGIVGAGIGMAQVLSTQRPTPVIDESRPGDDHPLPDGSIWDGPTVVFEGWRTVEAFGVALSVPPGWDVIELTDPEEVCLQAPDRPTLFIDEHAAGCDPSSRRAPVARLAPLVGDVVPDTRLQLGELDRVARSSMQTAWDARPAESTIVTHVQVSEGSSVRLTVSWAEVVIDADAQWLWASLRRPDLDTCHGPACRPPAGSTREVATLPVEADGRDLRYFVENPTDADWFGGAGSYAERWSGGDGPDAWQPYHVGALVEPIELRFPPGVSGPFAAWLPARPGYYRLVTTLSDGTSLFSEPVRVVMPDADRSTGPADQAVDLGSPRPVADSRDVAERSGAAARFVSCEGPLHLGGWAPDFGGPTGATGPEAAVQAFVEAGPFQLPADGYRAVAKDDGRVLFTYDVDGAPKVAVIVGDATQGVELSPPATGWGVEVFATCDPAEYAASADGSGPTIWTDAEGNRVPTTTLTSFPGPDHCNWQSATFLYLNDRQYLRDPQGVLRERTVADYEASAELPTDARDTGYRDGERELWLADDGSIAYVVTDGAVEAWPATTQAVACL